MLDVIIIMTLTIVTLLYCMFLYWNDKIHNENQWQELNDGQNVLDNDNLDINIYGYLHYSDKDL